MKRNGLPYIDVVKAERIPTSAKVSILWRVELACGHVIDAHRTWGGAHNPPKRAVCRECPR
jgi:hypothetical protein